MGMGSKIQHIAANKKIARTRCSTQVIPAKGIHEDGTAITTRGKPKHKKSTATLRKALNFGLGTAAPPMEPRQPAGHPYRIIDAHSQHPMPILHNFNADLAYPRSVGDDKALVNCQLLNDSPTSRAGRCDDLCVLGIDLFPLVVLRSS